MRSWTAIALTAALASVAGCQAQPESEGDAAPATSAPAEAKRINVETLKITPSDFRRVVTYAGETAPSHEVIVAAEAAGRILSLSHDENEVVEADELLARLDTRAVRGQIDQAQAQLVNATTQLDRIQPLLADKLVTPAQIEQAEAQVRAAKAALQAARTQKNLAQVVSPIRGLVVERFKDPGEFAAPGEPLYRIANLWDIEVELRVPEDEVHHLRERQSIDVRMPGMPGEPTLTASVKRIGYQANRLNRTFPVELHVPNPELQLRAGMLAFAEVVQLDVPKAIVVPRDAIIEEESGRVAMVVVDGRAVMRAVTLGPGDDDRVVVASGLSLGDELVVVGQRQIVDGDLVKVLPPTPTSAAAEREASPAAHATPSSPPSERSGHP